MPGQIITFKKDKKTKKLKVGDLVTFKGDNFIVSRKGWFTFDVSRWWN